MKKSILIVSELIIIITLASIFIFKHNKTELTTSSQSNNTAENNMLYKVNDKIIERLYFEDIGNPLIYSNYPETIWEEGTLKGDIPVEKELCTNQIGWINNKYYGLGKHFNKVNCKAEKTYTAEFYHGRNSAKSTDYIFGIAFIYNADNENEKAKITINKSGQGNTEKTNSLIQASLDTQFTFLCSNINNPLSDITDKTTSKPRILELNNKEAKIVIFEELTGLDGNVNGKINFTSNKDITMIDFYITSDKIKNKLSENNLYELTQDNLDKLNLYDEIYEISKDKNRVKKLEKYPKKYTTTTAYLNSDTKQALINASNNTKFYLSTAGHIEGIRDFNTNEYEALNENALGGYPYNNIRIHDGNYSIIYSIKLEGEQLTNKRIKITPYIPQTEKANTGIILYNSEYGWYYPKPNQEYWIMPISKDKCFKFMLPGNVYGDILFEVIE